MRNLVARFMKNETRTSAMDYSLIAGLASVVVLGTITTVGTKFTILFYTIVDKF
jgi:pilus assembly protein Flp/PilA